MARDAAGAGAGACVGALPRLVLAALLALARTQLAAALHCKPGHFDNGDRVTCPKCPENTVSPRGDTGLGPADCICAAGTWSATGTATGRMSASRIWVGVTGCARWSSSCSAGTYLAAAGNTTQDTCVPCPSDTYLMTGTDAAQCFAGTAVRNKHANLRTSVNWVVAMREGRTLVRPTPYSVQEMAGISEPVRAEIASRFGDILGFAHDDIAVLSPAILPSAAGGFDYFSRVTAVPGRKNFGTSVWHAHLTHDFHAAPGKLSSELTVMSSRAATAFGPEDPRAILGPSGMPLVVFNAKFAEGSPRSMFLADTAAGKVMQLHVHGMGDRTQKNWAPFWHDSALHFLYTAQPLTVLRCEDSSRGNCTCAFSATPGGCAELDKADASFRVRLGSPLVEIGDSGLFFTTLHSQVISGGADNSVHGYVGHLALLSSNPWGWVAVSAEVKFAPRAIIGNEEVLSTVYPRGISYPTTALLVGAHAQSILIAAHFNDAESSVQQLAFDEPLVDMVAKLATTACETTAPTTDSDTWVRSRHAHGLNSTVYTGDVPYLMTSRSRRVPRCAAWATLDSLANPKIAHIIAPLITSVARRLADNSTNCTDGSFFSANANPKCSACLKAGPGQRVTAPCTPTSNAIVVACAAGTYSAEGSQTSTCISCPTGISSAADVALTSVSACTICAPGYVGTVTSGGTADAKGCSEAQVIASTNFAGIDPANFNTDAKVNAMVTALEAALTEGAKATDPGASVVVGRIKNLAANGAVIYANPALAASFQRRLGARALTTATLQVDYRAVFTSPSAAVSFGAVLTAGSPAFATAVATSLAASGGAFTGFTASSMTTIVTSAPPAPPAAPAATAAEGLTTAGVIALAVVLGGGGFILIVCGYFFFIRGKKPADDGGGKDAPSGGLTVRAVGSSPRSPKVAPQSNV